MLNCYLWLHYGDNNNNNNNTVIIVAVMKFHDSLDEMAACGQSDLKHFIGPPQVSFPSSVYSCLCHFRLKRLLNESIEFFNPQEHCCRCYMYFIQNEMPTNVFLKLKKLICLVLCIVTGSFSETHVECRQVSLHRCSRHVRLVRGSGPPCWSCCSCHQDPHKRLEDRQKDTLFKMSVSFHLSVAEGRTCLGWTLHLRHQ